MTIIYLIQTYIHALEKFVVAVLIKFKKNIYIKEDH